MKKLIIRLQPVLLERRTFRAIVWFVAIAMMLYLAAIFCLGWREILAAFAALGLQTMLVGTLLSSSSYLCRFRLWEYSLQYLGNNVPRGSHFGIYLSGLALTATPGKSGETLRSALLLQHGVKVTHSLAAFIVDKGSDVLGMCLLGALAAVIVRQHFAWVWLLSFALILLGSCAFAYLLSHPLASAVWGRLGCSATWLPIKGGQATLEAWAKVWKFPRVLVFSIAAMLAYGVQALVFSWFCQIAGAGISIADCVLIFVQATLFGAASMIPGGLGATEAALALQLTERGISNGLAVSLAISIRLVTLWFGMLLGAVSLFFLSSKNPEPKQPL